MVTTARSTPTSVAELTQALVNSVDNRNLRVDGLWREISRGVWGNTSQTSKAQVAKHVSLITNDPTLMSVPKLEATLDQANSFPTIKSMSENALPSSKAARMKVAYDILMGGGLNRIEAIGMLANIDKESSFSTENITFTKIGGDGGLSIGIIQWKADKNPAKNRQLDFQLGFGKPLNHASYQEQIKFILYELSHKEKAARERMRTAKTSAEAAAIISKSYVRPQKKAEEARVRSARAVEIENSRIV